MHGEQAEAGELLQAVGLSAGYGRIEVLHGIDLWVGSGETVAVLGPNGAGKTTLLRALSRSVPTRGRILFHGVDLAGVDTSAAARLGLVHVPAEGAGFFDLTVLENLRLGALAASCRSRGPHRRERWVRDLEWVFALFPALADRRRTRAGALSGGEQQMVALARALLSRPRLLMLDEPSQSLAPQVVASVFGVLADLRKQWGAAVVVAEQNVPPVLQLCERVYVLACGRVVRAAPASGLTAAGPGAASLNAAAQNTAGSSASGAGITYPDPDPPNIAMRTVPGERVLAAGG